MQNSEISKKRLVLPGIDYTPAELQKGKNDEWRIVFYAMNPYKDKLERIRKRVKPMSNKTVRTQFALKIITEINLKLAKGWNPFIENDNVNAFNKLTDCFDEFLLTIAKKVKDEALRPDTLRGYTSYIGNIKSFMKEKKIEDLFVIGFNKQFVGDFLDWIYYIRENSPTTHNNHLQFVINISNYFIKKSFISSNPGEGFSKIKEVQKKRQLIPNDVKYSIKEYLERHNKAYYLLCMMTYYCFIRRTELTKMKVGDINLQRGVMMIEGGVSKTGTSATVTIPKPLLHILVEHLNGCTNDQWLFSANGFSPGSRQLKPKKISDTWSVLRNALNLPSKYQFYSLKDTGITDTLNKGVPSLKVRNQARHSDIKTTEKYTPRNIARKDEDIFNSGIEF